MLLGPACLRRTHPLPQVVLTVSKYVSQNPKRDLGRVSITCGSGWVRRRHDAVQVS